MFHNVYTQSQSHTAFNRLRPHITQHTHTPLSAHNITTCILVLF